MPVTTRRPPIEHPSHIPQIVHLSAGQILKWTMPKDELALPTLGEGEAAGAMELASQIVRYAAESLRGQGWTEEQIESHLAKQGLVFSHPAE